MKTSVFLDDRITAEIAARGDNRSGTISRDLERLYAMYARSLKEVPLSLDEVRYLVDCCNATIYDARTATGLWGSIEDSYLLDGLDKKWGVDGPALTAKIRALTQIQAMALIDAAERFWELPCLKRNLDEDLRKLFNIV
jgi:hypothetical protein